MMDGSGDGRLSYTYILSAKREHRWTIIWAINQVNTKNYVSDMELQTKTTVF